jgi:uncharacterized membrane protein
VISKTSCIYLRWVHSSISLSLSNFFLLKFLLIIITLHSYVVHFRIHCTHYKIYCLTCLKLPTKIINYSTVQNWLSGAYTSKFHLPELRLVATAGALFFSLGCFYVPC